SLSVNGADEVLILADIRLPKEKGVSEFEELAASLTGLSADYDTLLEAHAKIHGEIFNRVSFDIGGGRDHLRTTEELLELSTWLDINRALIEKQFDAGRYNILCSTGKLPPNLQGIWGGTYVPGWASDYTHNGNVPSAIAANLPGNMPELTTAYTSYIESLIPDLELNAKHFFGARGVVLPSRTSTHGYNNAFCEDFAGGMWISGAGKAARFFYDYYLFTGDEAFLTQHAVPYMEKVALFFEDYLYEGPDGKWIFSPTQSPENWPAGSKSQASYNATMDVAVAKEVLHNLIEASRIVGVNQDKIPVWENMLEKMPPYMLNEDGIIKEWLTPRLGNNDKHRHSSQLYPLYYVMPEELDADPELKEGFRKSVEFKLAEHWKDPEDFGFMSFGLVQLGQVVSTLGDGELAYLCLRHLVNRFWLNNLASMHNHRNLFNMDISGGQPALIIQMLVGSVPGKIRLLPALPEEWPEGSIEGVLARGAIAIERLEWSQKQVKVALRSKNDQTIALEIGHKSEDVILPAGKTVSVQLER
ncbi:MAG: glycosyl hydrolase family 95 catalytic domain-containing protein, partial [Opitutales bacterium]